LLMTFATFIFPPQEEKAIPRKRNFSNGIACFTSNNPD
jgi:hypothetical protein